MAISVIGTPTTAQAIDGPATLNLSLPAGLAQGDVVYVVFSRCGAGGGGGGGTSSGGWSQIGSSLQGNLGSQVFRKVMGSTPDTAIALNGPNASAGNSCSAIAIAYRGVDNLTPEDATPVSATAASADPDPPSITTTTANARVLAAFSTTVIDVAWTAPTGYANTAAISSNDTFDTSTGIADKTVASAGAENPSVFSGVLTSTWVAWSIAIRQFVQLPPKTRMYVT